MYNLSSFLHPTIPKMNYATCTANEVFVFQVRTLNLLKALSPKTKPDSSTQQNSLCKPSLETG